MQDSAQTRQAALSRSDCLDLSFAMGWYESSSFQNEHFFPSVMVESANSSSNSIHVGGGGADAVDGGDLSQWSYLTTTFDHDDIFQERPKPDDHAVMSSAPAQTSTSTSAFPTTASAPPMAVATKGEPHHRQHNFISTNVVINRSFQGNMFLPPQSIRYDRPGCDEPVTLALEPTPLASFALFPSGATSLEQTLMLPPPPPQQSTFQDIKNLFCDNTTTENMDDFDAARITTATPSSDFVNPFHTDAATSLDLEPLVLSSNHHTLAMLDDFCTNQSPLEPDPIATTTEQGLVRASSCILGSTFPHHQDLASFGDVYQPNHSFTYGSTTGMVTATALSQHQHGMATLPTSFSCPSLPSSKKRSRPDTFTDYGTSGGRNFSPISFSLRDDSALSLQASTKSTTFEVGSSVTTTTTAQVAQQSQSQAKQKEPSSQDPSKKLKFCKPLKVYNYFYRDERDNIVHGMKQHGDPLPPPVNDFSQTKFEQLLHHRWYVDPVKERRVHRKMHGKIEFNTLSQVISGRWRSLPEHGRDFYRRVARADQEHYDQFMSAEAAAPSSTPSVPECPTSQDDLSILDETTTFEC